MRCELNIRANKLEEIVDISRGFVDPKGLELARKASGWRLVLFRSGHLREDLKNVEGVLMDYRLLTPRGALLRYNPATITASLCDACRGFLEKNI